MTETTKADRLRKDVGETQKPCDTGNVTNRGQRFTVSAQEPLGDKDIYEQRLAQIIETGEQPMYQRVEEMRHKQEMTKTLLELYQDYKPQLREQILNELLNDEKVMKAMRDQYQKDRDEKGVVMFERLLEAAITAHLAKGLASQKDKQNGLASPLSAKTEGMK